MARGRVLFLGLVAAGLAVGAGMWTVSRGDDGAAATGEVGGEPARPEAPARVEAPPPVVDELEPEASPPLVGPSGQPLPPDTVPRRSGLPERPPAQPPLEDGEAWDRLRAEAASALLQATLAEARGFAAREELDPEARDRVIGIVEDHHAALATVRAEVVAGTRSPREGREAIATLRGQARTALSGVLGEDRAASFIAAVDAAAPGGI